MKPKRKVVIGSIVLLIFSYLLWTQRPVNIFWAGSKIKYDSAFAPEFNVCNDRNFGAYDIVVNHLALTEWGRIHWYLDHKDELKKKYGIPSCDSWIITFWDIGGGFTDIKTSGDSDLYCFPPTKESKKHCIEKNILMDVDFDAGFYERFSFSDSDYYWITMPDGKLLRIKTP